MLTSEDIALFVDRATTWLFSQKVETILLLLALGFFAYQYNKTLEDNATLLKTVIELTNKNKQ